MKTPGPHDKSRPHDGRPAAARVEYQRDPYGGPAKSDAEKPAEPAVCPSCKAVFRDGRWAWPDAPPTVRSDAALCPACQRIHDHNPAGEVRISGEFARAHRDEILARVRHVAERESAERPLIRIMATREQDGELLISTTDTHLAHAIGRALHDAFKGDLHAPWEKEGTLARVSWQR
jgi:NMD protein affecting ribosome stability and mRNA decay